MKLNVIKYENAGCVANRLGGIESTTCFEN